MQITPFVKDIIVQEFPLETYPLDYLVSDCLNNIICDNDSEDDNHSDNDNDNDSDDNKLTLDEVIYGLQSIDFYDEEIKDSKKEINRAYKNRAKAIDRIRKGDTSEDIISTITYLDKFISRSEHCLECIIRQFADAIDNARQFSILYTQLRENKQIDAEDPSKLILFLCVLIQYNIPHLFKSIALIDMITPTTIREIEGLNDNNYEESYQKELIFLYQIWKEHIIIDTLVNKDVIIKDIANIILTY